MITNDKFLGLFVSFSVRFLELSRSYLHWRNIKKPYIIPVSDSLSEIDIIGIILNYKIYRTLPSAFEH